MLVAALYDVHGNLPAIEAVLAEPDVRAAELIVVGGDCVAGPQPRETLERLLALGDRARFVRGNADRETVESRDAPSRDDEIGAATHWVAQQLSGGQLDFLAALPLTTVVEVDGLGEVLFCHATPRDDEVIFTRLTPEERMRELLAGVEQRIVVCGHTHVQVDREVAGVRVVNAGSVGLPYEGGPGAYWALLGPDVEHRRTEYDVDAAAADFADKGPDGDGSWFTSTLLEAPTAEHASETFERMARGE
ncbi:MAG: metallophosphoesterase family protein [Thermoleophilia bacterium]|nr:metallophosphoesterase family protein [Thermoleophilia bacterium]